MITPVGEYVLVKKLEDEERKVGSIVIVSDQSAFPKAKVVSTNRGRYHESGQFLQSDFSKGQIVLYQPYGAHAEVTDGDERLLLIRESDIIATVSEEGTDADSS
jgi:co-chaperonin GroES (HSP10)